MMWRNSVHPQMQGKLAARPPALGLIPLVGRSYAVERNGTIPGTTYPQNQRIIPKSIFWEEPKRPPIYGGALFGREASFLEQLSHLSTMRGVYPQFSATYPQIGVRRSLLSRRPTSQIWPMLVRFQKLYAVGQSSAARATSSGSKTTSSLPVSFSSTFLTIRRRCPGWAT